jgi:hypothetical protein
MVRTISFLDPDGADCEIALWCHGVPLRRFEDRIVETISTDGTSRAASPA